MKCTKGFHNSTRVIIAAAFVIVTGLLGAIASIAAPSQHFEMGEDLVQSGKPQDAYVQFLKALEEGDYRAANRLGELHYDGLVGDQDVMKALTYFIQANQAGVSDASLNIALLFEDAVFSENQSELLKLVSSSQTRTFSGVDEVVLFFLLQAARDGNAKAQLRLCTSQEFDEPMFPLNPVDVVRWCVAAYKGGETLAGAILGRIYEKGEGVTPNLEEAFKYYKAASEGDVSQAAAAGLARVEGLIDKAKSINASSKTLIDSGSPGRISKSSVEPSTGRRLALVVGINDYENLPQLQKAVNDSRAVSNALTDIGYEVVSVENPDRRTLSKKLSELQGKIQPGDNALFYFAGHGVALGGENILIAADMPKPASGDEDLVRDEGFSVDDIVRRIQKQGAKTAFLVLDACRDNPFEAGGTRSIGGTRGLEKTDAPSGVFVLFSAGIGQAALDRLGDNDNDPNSVFTRKLLPVLGTKGLTLTGVAKSVQKDVAELASTINHAQQPAYYDQIIGEVVINPQ